MENRRKPDGEPIHETTEQKNREIPANHLLDYFGGFSLMDITSTLVRQRWNDFPVDHETPEEFALAVILAGVLGLRQVKFCDCSVKTSIWRTRSLTWFIRLSRSMERAPQTMRSSWDP